MIYHFISKISEMDHKSSSLELFPRLNQYEVLINKNVLITEPDIRALITFPYTYTVYRIFKVNRYGLQYQMDLFILLAIIDMFISIYIYTVNTTI